MNRHSTGSVNRVSLLTHSTGSYERTDVRTDVDAGHLRDNCSPYVTRTRAYGEISKSTRYQRRLWAAQQITTKESA